MMLCGFKPCNLDLQLGSSSRAKHGGAIFLGRFWTKIQSDNCFETVSTPGLLLEGWHCCSSNFVYNFNKTPWFPLMWMVRFVTFVHIEKKPFIELYPRLLEGDQVWIYRDADANAIARLMPYAHVVVYLGQNEKGQGEVVHVTNNERCCMPCRTGWCRTGTIKKAAIEDVIEENDEGKSQFQKH